MNVQKGLRCQLQALEIRTSNCGFLSSEAKALTLKCQPLGKKTGNGSPASFPTSSLNSANEVICRGIVGRQLGVASQLKGLKASKLKRWGFARGVAPPILSRCRGMVGRQLGVASQLKRLKISKLKRWGCGKGRGASDLVKKKPLRPVSPPPFSISQTYLPARASAAAAPLARKAPAGRARL